MRREVFDKSNPEATQPNDESAEKVQMYVWFVLSSKTPEQVRNKMRCSNRM